jgi:hypothetical protein
MKLLALESSANAQVSEIPQEVKRAVRGLDNPVRWKIVEVLRANFELSYTQLMESLHIEKGRLTYHLNELLKGAIIQNYSKDGLESQYDSFYAVTHFGEMLISSLIEPLRPPQAQINFTIFNALVTPNISISLGLSISSFKPSYVRALMPSEKYNPINLERFYTQLKEASPYQTIYLSSAGGQFPSKIFEIPKIVTPQK